MSTPKTNVAPAIQERVDGPVMPAGEATKTAPPTTYHHGALKDALLKAAEQILERDGIQGLTLRGAAREAGVSHAAPKNHFGDIRGLLSELAAVGFARLGATIAAECVSASSGRDRWSAAGRGYIRFARENPGLFLLMFRAERLDFERPALKAAAQAAFGGLAAGVMTQRGEAPGAHLTLDQAAGIVSHWSLVHGLAMLLLDGRLSPVFARLPEGKGADDLIGAILSGQAT